MEAYRDQYATLFNAGKKVVVIGISTDPDTAQQSWARDAGFPMLFASDPDGAVGRLYGAYDAQNKVDNRTLLVIGPDGRIAHQMRPFRQTSPNAYTELAGVIDKLAPEDTAK